MPFQGLIFYEHFLFELPPKHCFQSFVFISFLPTVNIFPSVTLFVSEGESKAP